MAGRYQLSIAAKVQGEAEPVIGKAVGDFTSLKELNARIGGTMNISSLRIILTAGIGLVAVSGWSVQERSWPVRPYLAALATAAERHAVYYRDPGGAPFWSATPKKDAQGRDYLPVYDDEVPSFEPAARAPKAAEGSRKILYYRNPMGLPDTSPVTKKDPMGMDYVAVYEGDEPDDGSVKLTPGK
ncbi:hypothetical protein E4T56_gene2195, partial [Termitomyces sp. T112]